MNTKQKIGRACMIVGILLILGALALLGYNQWDANRADKASQDALGKLEETLTETMEDKTKDEEPVVQPELDPEQEMTVTDIDGWGYIGYLSIPSIGLELPVMSEWSYAGLKVAPGRYSGSTYADNMVVCAHNYAKHFSPIKWLALGSEVYFTDMDGQRWSYEVSNVETIHRHRQDDHGQRRGRLGPDPVHLHHRRPRSLRRALHPHRLPGLGDQRGRADHGVSRTIWNCLRFAPAISAENYF